jgi:hypothetical protein
MVKRHENTPIYVVYRVDRFHPADGPVSHDVTVIEAVPTITEAWAERDRLNALATSRSRRLHPDLGRPRLENEYGVQRCRWYPDGREVEPGAGQQPAAFAGTWVWPDNVEVVLETLSRWIGYAFDDADWTAVEHGLLGSDADADRWCEYPLSGEVRLDVRLARNVGADPVSIQVSSTDAIGDDLRVRIETALELGNCYRLAAPERQD